MNQSNVIFAFLFAAFIIFVTMRGDLPKYLGFVLGETAPATPGGPVADTGSQASVSSSSTLNSIIGRPPTATDIFKLFGG